MTPAPREVWAWPGLAPAGRVHVYDELPSTNDAAAGVPPGDAVVALYQTRGRGQYGRQWASRPGSSLLLSVAADPPTRSPVVLTAWAAVAVADAVEALAGVSPRLKWPNDLLVRGLKVCGILIEQGRHVVVGVGLNLSQTADEFCDLELPGAASLLTAAGRLVDVPAAADAVLRALAEWAPAVYGPDTSLLEAAWARRLDLAGRPAAVELVDGTDLVGRVRAVSFAAVALDRGAAGPADVPPERVRHVRVLDGG